MPLLRRTIIFANWVLLGIVIVGGVEAAVLLSGCFGIRDRGMKIGTCSIFDSSRCAIGQAGSPWWNS